MNPVPPTDSPLYQPEKDLVSLGRGETHAFWMRLSIWSPQVFSSSGRLGNAALRVNQRAFSLVEVVTALGIVAFVVVALIGLMSSGLDTFNSALDQSVRSQIAQRLVTEVQQSDLEELLLQPETLRYFDQEGTEADAEAEVEESVYTVMLKVKPETQLPKSTTSQNLLTVSVKIAQDPGRNPDPFGPTSRLTITEHTAFISRTE